MRLAILTSYSSLFTFNTRFLMIDNFEQLEMNEDIKTCDHFMYWICKQIFVLAIS